MNGWEIALAVGGGLAINELCELSPWLARQLVGWAARRRYQANPSRGAIRAEELVAVIDAQPGKLSKLITGLAFAAAAAGSIARDTTRRMLGVRPFGLVVRRVREYRLVLLPLISASTGATMVITDAISHADHRLGYPDAVVIGVAITFSIGAAAAQLRYQRRQRARPAAGRRNDD